VMPAVNNNLDAVLMVDNIILSETPFENSKWVVRSGCRQNPDGVVNKLVF